jgi:hypothetical protein
MVRYSGIINAGLITRHNIRRYERLGLEENSSSICKSCRQDKSSASSQEVWEDSFPLRGADGIYRWFLSRAVPIRNANGAVIRWFGTNTDTTEIKEAEEKLVEYQQELEAIVEERTKDLFLKGTKSRKSKSGTP